MKNKSKKLLTKSSESDILNELSRETVKESSKRAKRKIKKFLTKTKAFDKIQKLSLEKNDTNKEP